jgi:hypothetical protein
MVVVTLLEQTRYMGLVDRVARMAQDGHGVLVGGLSILMGGAAFLALSSATVRCLRRRDLLA